ARETLGQLRDLKLRPLVIQITSDPDLFKRDRPVGDLSACHEDSGTLPFDTNRDVRSVWSFANDALAPLGGLFDARTARGILASKELARWSACFAKREVGTDVVFVHLGMCSKSRPPLGWVMAQQSRQDIEGLLDRDGCNGEELRKLEQALQGQ